MLNSKFRYTEVFNLLNINSITSYSSLFSSLIQDPNPWLNVGCSTSSSQAKTRSLTSQKIDIKPSHSNSMRVQGIAPFIEAEISSHSVS